MSNAGYLNTSTQSGKGTPNIAGKGQEIYCTTVEPMVADMTQPRQPAIGRGAFPQDIYKAGTSGGIAAELEVPGKHIGYHLYYLSGAVAVTADTGPVNGAQVGVDTYTFKMAAGDFTLPYFTTIVSTEDVILTQLSDCRAIGGRLTFGANAALTATLTVAGIIPAYATAPGTPVLDTSPILVCSNSNALFEIGDASVEANQVVVDLTNVPAPVGQEMKIASPYRRDISVLARACTVTVRRWTDATTYKNLYFGGSTTWSASPYSAKAEVRAASGSVIAGTEPYSLEFEAAEVGFMGCRIPQRGQTLTLMEMVGVVVIPAAGEEFQFVLGSVSDVNYTAVPA